MLRHFHLEGRMTTIASERMVFDGNFAWEPNFHNVGNNSYPWLFGFFFFAMSICVVA